MKKYVVESSHLRNTDRWIAGNNKNVIFLVWRPRKGEIYIEGSDVVAFAYKLGMRTTNFDEDYGVYPVEIFVSNEDYSISMRFSSESKELFFSIICKDRISMKKAIIVIDKLINLESNKELADVF